MAYSGTIRGAIAFGLACSLELENELNKTVLVSGTLMLVLGTTVVFGAFMPIYVAYCKSFDTEEEKKQTKDGAIIPTITENIYDYALSHPNFNEESLVTKEKDELVYKRRLSYYLVSRFTDFDTNVIKPFLLYDYPKCIEDHEILSKKIINLTKELSNFDKKYDENEMTEVENQIIFNSNKL